MSLNFLNYLKKEIKINEEKFIAKNIKFQNILRDFFDENRKFYVGDIRINYGLYCPKNVLICGKEKTGKTLKIIQANIINQKKNSLFIVDRNNYLKENCKGYLKRNKYEIFTLNKENIKNNIFSESYKEDIKIENDKDIDIYLNNIFEIYNDDDFYEKTEITLFRCIAKQLLLKDIYFNIKNIVAYCFNKDFENLKNELNMDDEYISKNFEDFLFYFGDMNFLDYEKFKDNIKNKYIFFEKYFSNNFLDSLDFSLIRKKKMAIFLDLDSIYEDEENILIISMFIETLLKQLNVYSIGLEVNLYLDNFDFFDKINNLSKYLKYSQVNNYSIFISMQSIGKFKIIYNNEIFDIFKCLNSVIICPMFVLEDLFSMEALLGTRLINCGIPFLSILNYKRYFRMLLIQKDFNGNLKKEPICIDEEKYFKKLKKVSKH